MNKYEKWYASITENAKNRVLTDYKERHHIVPRSIGGSDDKSNIVDLTAREHFICHWLLTKMYIGDNRGKMINAMYMMRAESKHQKRYESKITGRIYENLRKEYSEYISKLNTGRKQPPEEKVKQISAITGRNRPPFSDEWRANLSKARLGKSNSLYGIVFTDERRKKISEKAKGRKQSSETIDKRVTKLVGVPRPKLHCIHCDQMIAVNVFPRWHGDNCKSR